MASIKCPRRKKVIQKNKMYLIKKVIIAGIIVICCILLGIIIYFNSFETNDTDTSSFENYEKTPTSLLETNDIDNNSITISESYIEMANKNFDNEQYEECLNNIELAANYNHEIIDEEIELISMAKYKIGCMKFEEGDYLSAYNYLRKLRERNLLKMPDYVEGNLENAINECRIEIAYLGKEYYDKGNYSNALECFDIWYQIDDETTYSNEWRCVNGIENIQGTWHQLNNSSYTITIEGTTINIKSDGNIIPNGTYEGTIELVDYFTEGDSKLFLNDTCYIELPSNNKNDMLAIRTLDHHGITFVSNSYVDTDVPDKSVVNKSVVNKSEPKIGMSHEEIEASTWGKPERINKTTYSWGTTEQWCYSSHRYIYFENGTVTAISE